MFETTIIAGKGNDVGSIIAQAIADNPRTAGTMGLKAFEKVLRRAAGKTGSILFKEVRGAFTKANPYGIKPLAQHPSGVEMAPKIERHFARKEGRRMKPASYPAGSGFRALMQYRMAPDAPKGAPVPAGPPNIEVGLIPERRGGEEWATKFRNWQKGGELNFPGPMRRMLAFLGIPDDAATPLMAPKREIMEQVERKENPLEIFQKQLYARLE
jgi:hypothetical protein